MARTGRSFPVHPILLGQVQALIAAQSGGTVVTPLIEPRVIKASPGRPARRVNVVMARWPGYQWVGLPPVTPLIEPHVQALTAETEQRRHVQSSVVAPRPSATGFILLPPHQNVQALVAETAPRRHPGHVFAPRWQVYQWVGLPPVTPLIEPRVQQLVGETEQRRHVQSSVVAPRPVATGVILLPPHQHVQVLVDETAPRRHPGHVFAPRWQAYQWVGLPPVTPLMQPHVQGLVGETEQRRHVQSFVVALAVQRFAAVSTPPPTTRLILPVVQSLVDESAPRRYKHGSVVAPRWQVYQWVGLPPVLPLPKQVVVEARAAQQRIHSEVVAPRPVAVGVPIVVPRPVLLSGASRRRRANPALVEPRPAGLAVPITPPRSTVVARPVPRPVQRLRSVVCQPRTVTQPVSPPRPVLLKQRGRAKPWHGGVLTSWVRPVTQTGVLPRRDLFGYPLVAALAIEAQLGDTGYPTGYYPATPLAPSPNLPPSPGLAPQGDSPRFVGGQAAEPHLGATGLPTGTVSGMVAL